MLGPLPAAGDGVLRVLRDVRHQVADRQQHRQKRQAATAAWPRPGECGSLPPRPIVRLRHRAGRADARPQTRPPAEDSTAGVSASRAVADMQRRPRCLAGFLQRIDAWRRWLWPGCAHRVGAEVVGHRAQRYRVPKGPAPIIPYRAPCVTTKLTPHLPISMGRSRPAGYTDMAMQNPREKPKFPPVEAAGPDGVLLVGGSLAPDWMLEAYRRGIFPMPIKVERRRHDRLALARSAGHPGIRRPARLAAAGAAAEAGRVPVHVRPGICSTWWKAVPLRADCDDDCWLTLAMQNAYLNAARAGPCPQRRSLAGRPAGGRRVWRGDRRPVCRRVDVPPRHRRLQSRPRRPGRASAATRLRAARRAMDQQPHAESRRHRHSAE